MSTYVHFTEEQKDRAAHVDLEEFLRRRGETLLPSGQDKRMKNDHSITIRGCRWFDHAVQNGGGAISFVQNYYGLSYPEAVSLLLGGEQGQAYPVARQKEKPPKPFALPPKADNARRVFAYLVQHRNLAPSVVRYFLNHQLLYEDARHHNCVFVGTDAQGVPRHAHLRSTNSRGKAFRLNVEGSDPRYSFRHMGTDGTLLVFEAPIDLLSHVTLHPGNWSDHSYVACCGTSVQPVLTALEQMPQPDTVYLCLDNDAAGHAASERMAGEIAQRFDVTTERLLPVRKDWNEDLCAMTMEMR